VHWKEKNVATEVVDYGAVIADLEAKIAALQGMLAAMKAAQASGVLGAGVAVEGGGLATSSTGIQPVELPVGALMNKSIPDAIKLYLGSVKKKKTNAEIADALKEGGVESTSSDFMGIVTSALNRLRGQNEVLRFADGWGLASLYPPHVRAAVQDAKRKPSKSSRKKARKAKPTGTQSPEKQAEAQGAQTKTAPPAASGFGLETKVAGLLHSTPGKVFSVQEIAEMTGAKAQGLPLLLGRLASKGVAQKAGGGYQAGSKHRAM
jgi:hypothetical protein